MIYYFHAIVVLSVILSSIFVLRWERGISVHFAMIFLFIPVINLGYLKVATAQSVSEALLANTIEYFDGCFLELFFFLYVMNFCRVKMPKICTAILLTIGSVILFFSMNTEKNGLLYKSAELRSMDGVSYLVKEYGPVHTFYYVVIALYLIVNLSMILYSLTSKNISKTNSVLMLIVYLVIIFAFLVGKAFHPALELLPASYTFAQIMFLVIMRRITLYDVSGSFISNLAENGSIGFVSFDLKLHYLGCTDPALECLPELDDLYVDQTLTGENPVFADIMNCIRHLDEKRDDAFFYVTQNDIGYKVTAEYLYVGKKIKGYQLRTEDNTPETRRLEAMKLKERQQEMEAEILRLEKSSAEAANEAKSSFLAQMSHEIRTPINAILGMNEMVLRECTQPEIREYAANIQSSGKTLLSIINTILDFSKIEDGKMEIVPVEYETAVLINDLKNTVAERAKEKGLDLILQIDPELPRKMRGDDVRIRQVISNLLTNAVKYTENGSVTLCIRKQKTEDAAVMVYAEVTDTGIGIKEEDLQAMFESFKRLDLTHNRSIEGTGLGMSIVTGLLEKMNSHLEVKSVYGQGSVFSFEIRQEIVDAQPMGDYDAVARPVFVKSEESFRAPEADILVVDDNGMNLKVADKLLGIFGIQADLCSSGRECLKKLREKQYDILFLDHMMPEMNGFETLEAIREQDLIPDTTTVVALTANAIAGVREMYLAKGFDDYLSKPIDSRELCQLLEKHLPEEKKISSDQGKDKIETDTEKEVTSTEMTDPAEEDHFSEAERERLHEVCPQMDIETAMTYCMDSKEFFYETLRVFAEEEKSGALQQAFMKEDYEQYRITVHSMKSSLKTIGVAEISEKAKQLEFASRDGDIAFVKTHHDAFLREYKEVLEAITKVLT